MDLWIEEVDSGRFGDLEMKEFEYLEIWKHGSLEFGKLENWRIEVCIFHPLKLKVQVPPYTRPSKGSLLCTWMYIESVSRCTIKREYRKSLGRIDERSVLNMVAHAKRTSRREVQGFRSPNYSLHFLSFATRNKGSVSRRCPRDKRAFNRNKMSLSYYPPWFSVCPEIVLS